MTTESELAAIGAHVERLPESRYKLAGVTVRRGVSAFCQVVVINASGIPSINTTVVNLFPDGNGEIQKTSGNGLAQFMYGAGSAFTTPGTGPFTTFLTLEAWKDEDPPRRVHSHEPPISDVARSLGDFEGTHTEIYLQFVERGAVPVPPPSDLPLVTSADELRNLALQHVYPQGISFLPTAALISAARERKLGVPVTNEGRYVDAQGTRYAYQAFVLGIVTTIEGRYAPGDFSVTQW